MRYERVKVKRDTNTVYNKFVLPWEVPILEFTFEEGNVEKLDEYETNDSSYPSAAVEFDRLAQAYGSDPKSGIPYVALVYGDSRRGVKELAKAIDEARAAEDAVKPRAKAARSRRATAQSADPLMG